MGQHKSFKKKKRKMEESRDGKINFRGDQKANENGKNCWDRT